MSNQYEVRWEGGRNVVVGTGTGKAVARDRNVLDAIALSKRLNDARGTVGMVANVFSNGRHTQLRVEVGDLEELIVRCGWTVLEGVEGLTDEARTRVAELEERGVEGKFSSSESDAALLWWRSRVLSEKPALTPDM